MPTSMPTEPSVMPTGAPTSPTLAPVHEVQVTKEPTLSPVVVTTLPPMS